MAVRTRIDPIDRDIAFLLSDALSPEAQSRALADYAREQFDVVQETNTRALGRAPEHEQFVDGSRGAALDRVRPDGRIIFEFELVSDVLEFIQEQLIKHSPTKTGRYSKSHVLFADDREVQFGADVPEAAVYAFVNAQPYARKIDRGLSRQAPAGVYLAVAALAKQRFGNIARVAFSFRAINARQLHTISRIGPLQVKRGKNGRYLKGSHTRAGSAAERNMRQPAIIVSVR